MNRRGIVAGALALAFALLSWPALAQVNQGTSPLSIPKGGTGGATMAAARSSLSATPTISVKDYGAKGDCTTDDTASFQSAENAAFGSSGGGSVYVPPTSSCYLVSKINATNHSGVMWYGVGDQSIIKVTGKDSSNNWWDMSGSSRRTIRDIKVIPDASTVPDNIFLWACTGASCATSGIVSGLDMQHVNSTTKQRVAFLYAYGYGCVAGAACPGNASFHLANGTWSTVNNVGTANDYLTGVQSALLHLTATNDRSVTSAYVSVLPGTATAWRGLIENMDFIDFSNGSAKANNSAVVMWNTTQTTLISGSYQCVCYMAVGQYSNTENIMYMQPNFEQPNGAGGVTLGWIFLGQGSNTYTTILNGFSSDAAVAAVVIGPAISAGTLGGTWGLNIIGNNLNINAGHRLVGIDPSGCGGWTAASNWIAASTIELQPAGVGIQTCGSVGSDTIVRGDTISVSVPGGATDNSFHIPGFLANPTALVGLTAVNGTAATGMRSDGAPALSQAIVPTWTGKHTFSGTVINGGNISAPAWTINGLMYSGTGGVHTDTTSSGTVATAYDNLFGSGTIAASSVTTFTNYFGVFIKDPTASTNVTLTNRTALGAESAKLGTTGTWQFQNAGNAIGTTAAAHCLTTGLNGVTNPAFDVDCSAASQVSGLRLFGSATGVAPGIVATDSASSVNLSVNAKGTGQTLIGNTSSGGVNLGFGGGNTTINNHVVVEGVTSTGATGTNLLVFGTAPTLDNATLSTRLNKGVYIIGMSAATGMTVTGTTGETTLATVAVPGNSMGANGAVRITAQWTKTGTAGTTEAKIKFGGTTFFDSGAAGATVLSGRQQTEIHNRNATNSQIGTSISSGTGNWNLQSTTASVATALDTTASQNVTFTCQLGNTGDTCELSSYTVELLSP